MRRCGNRQAAFGFNPDSPASLKGRARRGVSKELQLAAMLVRVSNVPLDKLRTGFRDAMRRSAPQDEGWELHPASEQAESIDDEIGSQPSPPRGVVKLAIVELGGSHGTGQHLKDWLAAVAAEAGSIVIVPGGGPFAEAVRKAQAPVGYDDRAAHVMALMAMAQFGSALASLNPALELTASRSGIRRALKAGRVPVWSPEPMARAAQLPESWDLTSDSLAAWLAGALGASRLVLVKHGRFRAASVSARDLAARAIVDPLFPHYLKESGVRACLAGPADSSRFAEGLRRPLFPEIVADPETDRRQIT